MPAGVAIRPYEQGDAEDLLTAVRESIAELEPWMPWCHAGYSLDEAAAWIEHAQAGHRDGSMYDFAITVDGRFAGACGINQINGLHRFANLGYWMRTSCAGRGSAPLAVRQLLDWTFRNTNFNRIEIVAAVDNVRSQRVAEKVGAAREAVLARRTMVRGEPADAIMYAVLRTR